ncbi:MAG: helix-turn-helix domain-containing protein [Chloroflexia bacterium]
MQLGPNLRAARTRRGMTLAALAAASGLSKGFISQVENDKTSPSLDTLERLAAALGVTVVDLLRSAGEPPPAPHVVSGALLGEDTPPVGGRPSQGRLLAVPVRLPAASVREISPPGASLRSFVVEMPPGTTLGELSHQHQGDESLVVLLGSLDADQDGRPVHLREGDSLSWTPGARHRLLNRGHAHARLLITLAAPATLGAPGLLGSPKPRPAARPPEARPLRLVQMRAARTARTASG